MGGELVLDAVPIVTPNCDVVVPSLSLTVISIIIIFTIFIIIIVMCPDSHSQSSEADYQWL